VTVVLSSCPVSRTVGGNSGRGVSIVADIISLSGKKQIKEVEKTVVANQRFFDVRKTLKAGRQARQCEKCHGTPGHDGGEQGDSRQAWKDLLPYRFCTTCADEYLDYIEYLKGRRDQDRFWQKWSWAETWKRWIDYRGALDSYLTSKEFLQRLQTIEQAEPDK
jgi:hypothetical protein